MDDTWGGMEVKAKPEFSFVREQTLKCSRGTRQALCCAWGSACPATDADYAGSNYYCERTGKETWGAGGGQVMLEL